MKNQDKKNGAARQTSNTLNPKNNAGQSDAGAEGGQGRPGQPTPVLEAEGPNSPAPGRTQGVCSLRARRRGRGPGGKTTVYLEGGV